MIELPAAAPISGVAGFDISREHLECFAGQWMDGHDIV